MLILSVPYSSSTEPVLKSIAKEADFIEYRLDYEKQLDAIDLRSFTSTNIITIRDTSEGGINHFTRDFKLRLYNEVICNTNALVDDELFHYRDSEPELKAENLILSWHAGKDDFSSLPDMIDLSNSLAAKYLKIAINIDHYLQLHVLYTEIKRSNKPVILAGLGMLGKISRILYSHLGAIATYAGLSGQETAMGQLTYDEYLLYNLQQMKPSDLIGGVIGGDQVWHSHGLKHYNQLFYDSKLPAHYLAFPVSVWEDFWNWFNTASEYITFFGLSITMPWKKQIALSVASSKLTLNTFLPSRYSQKISPWEENTDLLALKRSLTYLNIDKTASVLVFGTGAMAETAISYLSNKYRVSFIGRNKKHQNELSDVFNVPVASENALKHTKWNLLINCSSLGMKLEPLDSFITGLCFDALIDLPYVEGDTALVKYCREKDLQVVSGDMFWKWQAQKQEELFLLAIQQLQHSRVTHEM